MVACTILVLGMIPGLGFFEVGLLPANCTTSVLSQIMASLPILSVMWVLFGYSLSFGSSNFEVIGNLQHAAWSGVSTSGCREDQEIPEQLFALFQMMFATITPLLMTGAFAGRMKFDAALSFIVAWEIFVYYPCCYMIWGGGWLAEMGVLDFAGGIVIHTSAGVGALVAAAFVGKRREFIKHGAEVPPSNVAMACIGTAMLWSGWFGFNGGSSFSLTPVTVSAIVNTQVAAAVSGCVWLLLSKLQHGHTSLIPCINGSIAGLAGVTPAAGYITVGSACVLGLVLGVVCYGGVIVVKEWMKIDDALDVSVVHGLAGVIGSLAIGICATKAVNDEIMYNGAIAGGGGKLFWLQLLAVFVVAVWSAAFSFVILFVLEHTIGVTHKAAVAATKRETETDSTSDVEDSPPSDPASRSIDACSTPNDTSNSDSSILSLDMQDHRMSRAYRLECDVVDRV